MARVSFERTPNFQDTCFSKLCRTGRRGTGSMHAHIHIWMDTHKPTIPHYRLIGIGRAAMLRY